MDLKRKARCKAIIDTEAGCSGVWIRKGRLGRILATRNLTGIREHLIKWDGRSGPSSHNGTEIEIIND
jgi:Zn-finger nucleic acid-binding protein